MIVPRHVFKSTLSIQMLKRDGYETVCYRVGRYNYIPVRFHTKCVAIARSEVRMSKPDVCEKKKKPNRLENN